MWVESLRNIIFFIFVCLIFPCYSHIGIPCEYKRQIYWTGQFSAKVCFEGTHRFPSTCTISNNLSVFSFHTTNHFCIVPVTNYILYNHLTVCSSLNCTKIKMVLPSMLVRFNNLYLDHQRVVARLTFKTSFKAEYQPKLCSTLFCSVCKLELHNLDFLTVSCIESTNITTNLFIILNEQVFCLISHLQINFGISLFLPKGLYQGIPMQFYAVKHQENRCIDMALVLTYADNAKAAILKFEELEGTGLESENLLIETLVLEKVELLVSVGCRISNTKWLFDTYGKVSAYKKSFQINDVDVKFDSFSEKFYVTIYGRFPLKNIHILHCLPGSHVPVRRKLYLQLFELGTQSIEGKSLVCTSLCVFDKCQTFNKSVVIVATPVIHKFNPLLNQDRLSLRFSLVTENLPFLYYKVRCCFKHYGCRIAKEFNSYECKVPLNIQESKILSVNIGLISKYSVSVLKRTIWYVSERLHFAQQFTLTKNNINYFVFSRKTYSFSCNQLHSSVSKKANSKKLETKSQCVFTNSSVQIRSESNSIIWKKVLPFPKQDSLYLYPKLLHYTSAEKLFVQVDYFQSVNYHSGKFRIEYCLFFVKCFSLAYLNYTEELPAQSLELGISFIYLCLIEICVLYDSISITPLYTNLTLQPDRIYGNIANYVQLSSDRPVFGVIPYEIKTSNDTFVPCVTINKYGCHFKASWRKSVVINRLRIQLVSGLNRFFQGSAWLTIYPMIDSIIIFSQFIHLGEPIAFHSIPETSVRIICLFRNVKSGLTLNISSTLDESKFWRLCDTNGLNDTEFQVEFFGFHQKLDSNHIYINQSTMFRKGYLYEAERSNNLLHVTIPIIGKLSFSLNLLVCCKTYSICRRYPLIKYSANEYFVRFRIQQLNCSASVQFLLASGGPFSSIIQGVTVFSSQQINKIKFDVNHYSYRANNWFTGNFGTALHKIHCSVNGIMFKAKVFSRRRGYCPALEHLAFQNETISLKLVFKDGMYRQTVFSIVFTKIGLAPIVTWVFPNKISSSANLLVFGNNFVQATRCVIENGTSKSYLSTILYSGTLIVCLVKNFASLRVSFYLETESRSSASHILSKINDHKIMAQTVFYAKEDQDGVLFLRKKNLAGFCGCLQVKSRIVATVLRSNFLYCALSPQFQDCKLFFYANLNHVASLLHTTSHIETNSVFLAQLPQSLVTGQVSRKFGKEARLLTGIQEHLSTRKSFIQLQFLSFRNSKKISMNYNRRYLIPSSHDVRAWAMPLLDLYLKTCYNQDHFIATSNRKQIFCFSTRTKHLPEQKLYCQFQDETYYALKYGEDKFCVQLEPLLKIPGLYRLFCYDGHKTVTLSFWVSIHNLSQKLIPLPKMVVDMSKRYSPYNGGLQKFVGQKSKMDFISDFQRKKQSYATYFMRQTSHNIEKTFLEETSSHFASISIEHVGTESECVIFKNVFVFKLKGFNITGQCMVYIQQDNLFLRTMSLLNDDTVYCIYKNELLPIQNEYKLHLLFQNKNFIINCKIYPASKSYNHSFEVPAWPPLLSNSFAIKLLTPKQSYQYEYRLKTIFPRQHINLKPIIIFELKNNTYLNLTFNLFNVKTGAEITEFLSYKRTQNFIYLFLFDTNHGLYTLSIYESKSLTLALIAEGNFIITSVSKKSPLHANIIGHRSKESSIFNTQNIDNKISNFIEFEPKHFFVGVETQVKFRGMKSDLADVPCWMEVYSIDDEFILLTSPLFSASTRVKFSITGQYRVFLRCAKTYFSLDNLLITLDPSPFIERVNVISKVAYNVLLSSHTKLMELEYSVVVENHTFSCNISEVQSLLCLIETPVRLGMYVKHTFYIRTTPFFVKKIKVVSNVLSVRSNYILLGEDLKFEITVQNVFCTIQKIYICSIKSRFIVVLQQGSTLLLEVLVPNGLTEGFCKIEVQTCANLLSTFLFVLKPIRNVSFNRLLTSLTTQNTSHMVEFKGEFSNQLSDIRCKFIQGFVSVIVRGNILSKDRAVCEYPSSTIFDVSNQFKAVLYYLLNRTSLIDFRPRSGRNLQSFSLNVRKSYLKIGPSEIILLTKPYFTGFHTLILAVDVHLQASKYCVICYNKLCIRNLLIKTNTLMLCRHNFRAGEYGIYLLGTHFGSSIINFTVSNAAPFSFQLFLNKENIIYINTASMRLITACEVLNDKGFERFSIIIENGTALCKLNDLSAGNYKFFILTGCARSPFYKEIRLNKSKIKMASKRLVALKSRLEQIMVPFINHVASFKEFSFVPTLTLRNARYNVMLDALDNSYKDCFCTLNGLKMGIVNKNLSCSILINFARKYTLCVQCAKVLTCSHNALIVLEHPLNLDLIASVCDSSRICIEELDVENIRCLFFKHGIKIGYSAVERLRHNGSCFFRSEYIVNGGISVCVGYNRCASTKIKLLVKTSLARNLTLRTRTSISRSINSSFALQKHISGDIQIQIHFKLKFLDTYRLSDITCACLPSSKDSKFERFWSIEKVLDSVVICEAISIKSVQGCSLVGIFDKQKVTFWWHQPKAEVVVFPLPTRAVLRNIKSKLKIEFFSWFSSMEDVTVILLGVKQNIEIFCLRDRISLCFLTINITLYEAQSINIYFKDAFKQSLAVAVEKKLVITKTRLLTTKRDNDEVLLQISSNINASILDLQVKCDAGIFRKKYLVPALSTGTFLYIASFHLGLCRASLPFRCTLLAKRPNNMIWQSQDVKFVKLCKNKLKDTAKIFVPKYFKRISKTSTLVNTSVKLSLEANINFTISVLENATALIIRVHQDEQYDISCCRLGIYSIKTALSYGLNISFCPFWRNAAFHRREALFVGNCSTFKLIGYIDIPNKYTCRQNKRLEVKLNRNNSLDYEPVLNIFPEKALCDAKTALNIRLVQLNRKSQVFISNTSMIATLACRYSGNFTKTCLLPKLISGSYHVFVGILKWGKSFICLSKPKFGAAQYALTERYREISFISPTLRSTTFTAATLQVLSTISDDKISLYVEHNRIFENKHCTLVYELQLPIKAESVVVVQVTRNISIFQFRHILSNKTIQFYLSNQNTTVEILNAMLTFNHFEYIQIFKLRKLSAFVFDICVDKSCLIESNSVFQFDYNRPFCVYMRTRSEIFAAFSAVSFYISSQLILLLNLYETSIVFNNSVIFLRSKISCDDESTFKVEIEYFGLIDSVAQFDIFIENDILGRLGGIRKEHFQCGEQVFYQIGNTSRKIFTAQGAYLLLPNPKIQFDFIQYQTSSLMRKLCVNFTTSQWMSLFSTFCRIKSVSISVLTPLYHQKNEIYCCKYNLQVLDNDIGLHLEFKNSIIGHYLVKPQATLQKLQNKIDLTILHPETINCFGGQTLIVESGKSLPSPYLSAFIFSNKLFLSRTSNSTTQYRLALPMFCDELKSKNGEKVFKISITFTIDESNVLIKSHQVDITRGKLKLLQFTVLQTLKRRFLQFQPRIPSSQVRIQNYMQCGFGPYIRTKVKLIKKSNFECDFPKNSNFAYNLVITTSLNTTCLKFQISNTSYAVEFGQQTLLEVNNVVSVYSYKYNKFIFWVIYTLAPLSLQTKTYFTIQFKNAILIYDAYGAIVSEPFLVDYSIYFDVTSNSHLSGPVSGGTTVSLRLRPKQNVSTYQGLVVSISDWSIKFEANVNVLLFHMPPGIAGKVPILIFHENGVLAVEETLYFEYFSDIVSASFRPKFIVQGSNNIVFVNFSLHNAYEHFSGLFLQILHRSYKLVFINNYLAFVSVSSNDLPKGKLRFTVLTKAKDELKYSSFIIEVIKKVRLLNVIIGPENALTSRLITIQTDIIDEHIKSDLIVYVDGTISNVVSTTRTSLIVELPPSQKQLSLVYRYIPYAVLSFRHVFFFEEKIKNARIDYKYTVPHNQNDLKFVVSFQKPRVSHKTEEFSIKANITDPKIYRIQLSRMKHNKLVMQIEVTPSFYFSQLLYTANLSFPAILSSLNFMVKYSFILAFNQIPNSIANARNLLINGLSQYGKNIIIYTSKDLPNFYNISLNFNYSKTMFSTITCVLREDLDINILETQVLREVYFYFSETKIKKKFIRFKDRDCEVYFLNSDTLKTCLDQVRLYQPIEQISLNLWKTVMSEEEMKFIQIFPLEYGILLTNTRWWEKVLRINLNICARDEFLCIKKQNFYNSLAFNTKYIKVLDQNISLMYNVLSISVLFSFDEVLINITDVSLDTCNAFRLTEKVVNIVKMPKLPDFIQLFRANDSTEFLLNASASEDFNSEKLSKFFNFTATLVKIVTNPSAIVYQLIVSSFSESNFIKQCKAEGFNCSITTASYQMPFQVQVIRVTGKLLVGFIPLFYDQHFLGTLGVLDTDDDLTAKFSKSFIGSAIFRSQRNTSSITWYITFLSRATPMKKLRTSKIYLGEPTLTSLVHNGTVSIIISALFNGVSPVITGYFELYFGSRPFLLYPDTIIFDTCGSIADSCFIVERLNKHSWSLKIFQRDRFFRFKRISRRYLEASGLTLSVNEHSKISKTFNFEFSFSFYITERSSLECAIGPYKFAVDNDKNIIEVRNRLTNLSIIQEDHVLLDITNKGLIRNVFAYFKLNFGLSLSDVICTNNINISDDKKSDIIYRPFLKMKSYSEFIFNVDLLSYLFGTHLVDKSPPIQVELKEFKFCTKKININFALYFPRYFNVSLKNISPAWVVVRDSDLLHRPNFFLHVSTKLYRKKSRLLHFSESDDDILSALNLLWPNKLAMLHRIENANISSLTFTLRDKSLLRSFQATETIKIISRSKHNFLMLTHPFAKSYFLRCSLNQHTFQLTLNVTLKEGLKSIFKNDCDVLIEENPNFTLVLHCRKTTNVSCSFNALFNVEKIETNSNTSNFTFVSGTSFTKPLSMRDTNQELKKSFMRLLGVGKEEIYLNTSDFECENTKFKIVSIQLRSPIISDSFLILKHNVWPKNSIVSYQETIVPISHEISLTLQFDMVFCLQICFTKSTCNIKHNLTILTAPKVLGNFLTRHVVFLNISVQDVTLLIMYTRKTSFFSFKVLEFTCTENLPQGIVLFKMAAGIKNKLSEEFVFQNDFVNFKFFVKLQDNLTFIISDNSNNTIQKLYSTDDVFEISTQVNISYNISISTLISKILEDTTRGLMLQNITIIHPQSRRISLGPNDLGSRNIEVQFQELCLIKRVYPSLINTKIATIISAVVQNCGEAIRTIQYCSFKCISTNVTLNTIAHKIFPDTFKCMTPIYQNSGVLSLTLISSSHMRLSSIYKIDIVSPLVANFAQTQLLVKGVTKALLLNVSLMNQDDNCQCIPVNAFSGCQVLQKRVLFCFVNLTTTTSFSERYLNMRVVRNKLIWSNFLRLKIVQPPNVLDIHPSIIFSHNTTIVLSVEAKNFPDIINAYCKINNREYLLNIKSRTLATCEILANASPGVIDFLSLSFDGTYYFKSKHTISFIKHDQVYSKPFLFEKSKNFLFLHFNLSLIYVKDAYCVLKKKIFPIIFFHDSVIVCKVDIQNIFYEYSKSDIFVYIVNDKANLNISESIQPKFTTKAEIPQLYTVISTDIFYPCYWIIPNQLSYYPYCLQSQSNINPKKSDRKILLPRIPNMFSAKDIFNSEFIFRSNTQLQITICASGYFIEEYTRVCLPCLPGTYNSLTNQKYCKACELGFFCPGYATVLPLLCPRGQICSKFGLAYPNKLCPEGFYCLQGTITIDFRRIDTSKRPYPCPPGTYCLPETGALEIESSFYQDREFNVPQPCAEGFFCEAGSNSPLGMGPCPIGFFCPKGTAIPIPTPRGFYTAIKSSSDTIECPIGYYAPTIENAYCIQCPPGTTCPKPGMISPEVCPPGTYRSLGDDTFSCMPCPKGTWSRNWELRHQVQCLPCPPGVICSSSSVINICDRSDFPTLYSPTLKNETLSQCEAKGKNYFYGYVSCPIDVNGKSKTFNAISSQSHFVRVECTGFNAHLLPLVNKTQTQCYYNPRRDGTTLYQRLQTFYGPKFFIQTGQVHQGYGEATYEGYNGRGSLYLDLPTSSQEHPIRSCISGNFEYHSEKKDYYWKPGDCEADYICDTINQLQVTVAVSCPAGVYCPPRTGTQEQYFPCDEGYVCDVGTTNNRFTNMNSRFTNICPAGFYCPRGMMSIKLPKFLCLPGYFCPAGTIDPVVGLIASDQINKDGVYYSGSQVTTYFKQQNISCANMTAIKLQLYSKQNIFSGRATLTDYNSQFCSRVNTLELVQQQLSFRHCNCALQRLRIDSSQGIGHTSSVRFAYTTDEISNIIRNGACNFAIIPIRECFIKEKIPLSCTLLPKYAFDNYNPTDLAKFLQCICSNRTNQHVFVCQIFAVFAIEILDGFASLQVTSASALNNLFLLISSIFLKQRALVAGCKMRYDCQNIDPLVYDLYITNRMLKNNHNRNSCNCQRLLTCPLGTTSIAGQSRIEDCIVNLEQKVVVMRKNAFSTQPALKILKQAGVSGLFPFGKDIVFTGKNYTNILIFEVKPWSINIFYLKCTKEGGLFLPKNLTFSLYVNCTPCGVLDNCNQPVIASCCYCNKQNITVDMDSTDNEIEIQFVLFTTSFMYFSAFFELHNSYYASSFHHFETKKNYVKSFTPDAENMFLIVLPNEIFNNMEKPFNLKRIEKLYSVDSLQDASFLDPTGKSLTKAVYRKSNVSIKDLEYNGAIITFLPYFMNSSRFGNHFHLSHLLTHVHSPYCNRPLRRDTKPVLAMQPFQSVVGLECKSEDSFFLHRGMKFQLSYHPSEKNPTSKQKWFEKSGGSILFYISKNRQVEYENLLQKISVTLNILDFQTIPVLVNRQFASKKNLYPLYIYLLLEYRQLTQTEKQFLSGEVYFDDFCKATNSTFGNFPACPTGVLNYTLSLHLRPLNWLEVLNKLEFDLWIYIIVFSLLGVSLVCIGVVFHFSTLCYNLFNGNRKIRFLTWFKHIFSTTFLGVSLSSLVFVLLVASSQLVYLTKHLSVYGTSWEIINRPHLGPPHESRQATFLFMAFMIIESFVVFQFVPYSLPSQDKDNKRFILGLEYEGVSKLETKVKRKEITWYPKHWKRLSSLILTAVYIIFLNLNWQYIFKPTFGSQIYYYIIVFKLSKIVLEITGSFFVKDTLIIKCHSAVLDLFLMGGLLSVSTLSEFMLTYVFELILVILNRLVMLPVVTSAINNAPLVYLKINFFLTTSKFTSSEVLQKLKEKISHYRENIKRENRGNEPSVRYFATYSTEIIAHFAFPILLTSFLILDRQTSILQYYDLKYNDVLFYFIFAVIILVPTILLDIFLFNATEALYGLKVFDYISYQHFRFNSREKNWKNYDAQFDESLSSPLQSIDNLCFSSQYYFILMLHVWSILGMSLANLVLLKQGLNCFADPLSLPILGIMVIMLTFVRQILQRFQKCLKFWTLKALSSAADAGLLEKLRIGEIIRQKVAEDDDIKFLKDENFKEIFLKTNQPWLVQNVEMFLTPRNITKADDKYVDKIQKLYSKLLRDDLSELSSVYEGQTGKNMIKFKTTKFSQHQLDLLHTWQALAVTCTKFSKLVQPILSQNKKINCQICGVNRGNMEVLLSKTKAQSSIAFQKLVTGFKATQIKNAFDTNITLWKAYFRKNAIFYTVCERCLYPVYTDMAENTYENQVESKSPTNFSEIFKLRVISKKRNEGKALIKWLLAARHRLGGSFPKSRAKEETEIYIQKFRPKGSVGEKMYSSNLSKRNLDLFYYWQLKSYSKSIRSIQQQIYQAWFHLVQKYTQLASESKMTQKYQDLIEQTKNEKQIDFAEIKETNQFFAYKVDLLVLKHSRNKASSIKLLNNFKEVAKRDIQLLKESQNSKITEVRKNLVLELNLITRNSSKDQSAVYEIEHRLKSLNSKYDVEFQKFWVKTDKSVQMEAARLAKEEKAIHTEFLINTVQLLHSYLYKMKSILDITSDKIKKISTLE